MCHSWRRPCNVLYCSKVGRLTRSCFRKGDQFLRFWNWGNAGCAWAFRPLIARISLLAAFRDRSRFQSWPLFPSQTNMLKENEKRDTFLKIGQNSWQIVKISRSFLWNCAASEEIKQEVLLRCYYCMWDLLHLLVETWPMHFDDETNLHHWRARLCMPCCGSLITRKWTVSDNLIFQ